MKEALNYDAIRGNDLHELSYKMMEYVALRGESVNGMRSMVLNSARFLTIVNGTHKEFMCHPEQHTFNFLGLYGMALDVIRDLEVPDKPTGDFWKVDVQDKDGFMMTFVGDHNKLSGLITIECVKPFDSLIFIAQFVLDWLCMMWDMKPLDLCVTAGKIQVDMPKRQGDLGAPCINPNWNTRLPLMTKDVQTWDEDMRLFCDSGPIIGFREPFFRRVMTPLYSAMTSLSVWRVEGNRRGYKAALDNINQCRDEAIRDAARHYIEGFNTL